MRDRKYVQRAIVYLEDVLGTTALGPIPRLPDRKGAEASPPALPDSKGAGFTGPSPAFPKGRSRIHALMKITNTMKYQSSITLLVDAQGTTAFQFTVVQKFNGSCSAKGDVIPARPVRRALAGSFFGSFLEKQKRTTNK